MDKEQKPEVKEIAAASIKFFENFFTSDTKARNINSENDKAVSSALIYEKFRVALEYQEEHLIFKNAISRIVRRKYTLSSSISADKLFQDLVIELSWANYLNPETIDPKESESIVKILERYLAILKYSESVYLSKHELQKKIINWMACEIEELLNPVPERESLVDFCYSVLKNDLNTDGSKITEIENEHQLKLAIFVLIYKPDQSLIEYWVLNTIYPKWRSFSTEEAKRFAKSFEPNNNSVNKEIFNRYRTKYLQYTKRNVVPFILINNLRKVKEYSAGSIDKNYLTLKSDLLKIYDQLVSESQEKVWRGTIRALIFILMTKISLAFLLELPFDRYLTGEINYVSLTINVCLPPVLMLFLGSFLKSPGEKNRVVLAKAIDNILYLGKIGGNKFKLAKTKISSTEKLFNLFYTTFSVGIIGLVVWLLLHLEFNFLSILLFFIFVSAVSFFSFRIRNIVLELLMTNSKENWVVSLIEFVFLPFIRIGKHISERLSRSNPFILALDFLIEAPLKTIIRIVNSWLKFINTKKEEIEY